MHSISAVMDAHSKAMAIHRDLSLGNIILYRIPDRPIRVGYLIDWELGCKTDGTTAWNDVLTVSSYMIPVSSINNSRKGTPAFMSIAVSTLRKPHVHNMGDDLESLLYAVLYCALLWLPVESDFSLDWWLGDFFCARDRAGVVGAPAKCLNAITRFFTSGLRSTRSQAILGWLNAAMDLHHHAVGGPNPVGPNPAWDDGEALRIMWEETLVKELPDDDRHENTIPDAALRETEPLCATHTTNTTSTTLHEPHDTPLQQPPATSSKRSLSGTDESADLFKGDYKRQRRGAGQEGKDTDHNIISLLRASAVESNSLEMSPMRSGKPLRPTYSQILVPFVPGPSRRTVGETGPTPTTAPTSKPAATPTPRRSTRKRNMMKK